METREALAHIHGSFNGYKLRCNSEVSKKDEEALITLWNSVAKSEKNNKYRWHDLRRDPHDLPEDFKLCNVLVDYTDEKEYGIGYACAGRFKECHTFDGYSIGEAYMQHNDVKVIAWRYIEPFEGE